MKSFLYSLTIAFVTLLIQGCNSPTTIEDYYTLYPPDEWHDDYYLMCKMSDSNDPLILNVDYIKWSTKMIAVKQKNSNWWIIKAKGDSLKCCNQDKLIGPIREDVAKKMLMEMCHPKGEIDLSNN